MLDIIKDFIIQNWTWLLPVILSVVESFLIIILKKKPIYSKDYIWNSISCCLPTWIRAAEKKFDKPLDKLNYVILQACDSFPNYFKDGELLSILRNRIEDILDTPQKKGGK